MCLGEDSHVMQPVSDSTSCSRNYSKEKRATFPRLLTTIFCLSQSLGVCVCSESWAGSDCSLPRDSNSLVWETLLDTQLTVVGAQRIKKKKNSVTHIINFTPQHTQTHIHMHCCSTEPGPQVPPQDGPLSGVWTTGQPLDVWRALSVGGHSGKCLQV